MQVLCQGQLLLRPHSIIRCKDNIDVKLCKKIYRKKVKLKVLGVRCSHNDYSFIILDGSKASPVLADKKHVTFPKNYKPPKRLKWFLQEVEGFIGGKDITVVSIKGTEPMASKRSNLYAERVENESMVYLAAENKGIKCVLKKIKCTIAKDLGQKGRAKYIKAVDYSVFPDFNKLDNKFQEAIQVAWSCMK